MRKLVISYKFSSYILIASLLILTGCSKESDSLIEKMPVEIQVSEETAQIEEKKQIEEQEQKQVEEIEQIGESSAEDVQERNTEPIITEVDWSDYYDGLNGAAVIYDPSGKWFQMYNQETALTRRSPCSTFKIISSLIALEKGIIEPDDSVRTWSGEIFWSDEWNRDIDFFDAFHASCVWYFREVIDEIGKDTIQEELNRLGYGNCDISDWEGRLNTNNDNPVLTGFWIESSLLISPKEQVEVMERIFGEDTDYSEETLKYLKQAMLLSEQSTADISIYGKTGMGKSYGITVDAWYTGFADAAGRRIYFCVYLGETDNKDVSSAAAREIAVEIVSDYLKYDINK